ncbi:MAG: endonuclease SmrB [Candidatus Hamiltonella defensa (Ceratovacuna japonica)]
MMKNRSLLTKQESILFRKSIKGTKKLHQDTVFHSHFERSKINETKAIRFRQEQMNTISYFSDQCPVFWKEGEPVEYIQPDIELNEISKLMKEDYLPDILLDLHGLTQRQAKEALGSLIAYKRQKIECVNVIHGYGRNILKKNTPLWLMQHPKVLAFHQAPRRWGGSAALLVLIK